MPIKDKKTKSVTTPLLDKVNNPNDLKFLKLEDLDHQLLSILLDSNLLYYPLFPLIISAPQLDSLRSIFSYPLSR